MIKRLEALQKFLKSLNNLRQQGLIKSVDQAVAFAKQEFGEVNDLLKRQIEQVFKGTTKAPPPGGGGITSIKNAPKKETPPQESGTIMDRISKASNRIEELMKEQEAMYKPKQGLQLAEGLTRTIARKILDRKNIEIPKGRDPIGVFSDIFGESINDVNNLAEELIEIEQRGGGSKNIDEMIEMEGLFDINVPKNPSKGITDTEVAKLMDENEAEDMLPKMTERFKLKQKYPGINDELLSEIVEDPDPQNKAEALATLDQAMKLVEEGKGTDEIISILQNLKKTRKAL